LSFTGPVNNGLGMNSIDIRLNRLKAAVAAERARRPPPDAEYADGMERYKRRRAKEIKRGLRNWEGEDAG